MKSKSERLMLKSFKSFENLWNAWIFDENEKQCFGMYIPISDEESMFISIGSKGFKYGDENKVYDIYEFYNHEPVQDPVIKHTCKLKNVVVPKNFCNPDDIKHIGWYKCHILKNIASLYSYN